MKKAILLFPDSISLADFVLKYQIKGADVHSCEHTLSAELSDKELKVAQKQYGAELIKEQHGSFVNRHQQ